MKWIVLGLPATLVLVILGQNSADVTLALLWLSIELPLFVALLGSLLAGAVLMALVIALMLRRRRSGQ